MKVFSKSKCIMILILWGLIISVPVAWHISVASPEFVLQQYSGSRFSAFRAYVQLLGQDGAEDGGVLGESNTEHWNIDDSSLSDNLARDYQKIDMWNMYGKYMVAVSLIIFLQGILIVALISAHRKRLKAEAELHGLNESLESLVEERTWELQRAKDRLEEVNKELDYLSRIDPLTRLYNRRHMRERLQEEYQSFRRTGQLFSVMLLDVDDFKQINDSHGHAAGDFVLKKVANKLLKKVREYDVVARWGGEEFLLLFPGLKENDTLVRAECILKEVKNETYSYNGIEMPVTVTIGVATINVGGTIGELIDRADAALYDGKNTGKNKVVSN